MDVRRCLLLLATAGVLLGTTGCMADEVVYVDAEGREVAVDAEGRPVLPQAGPTDAPARALVRETVTSVPAETVTAAPTATTRALPTRTSAAASSPRAPTGIGASEPAPDPSWDLPAAASPSAVSAPSAPARAPAAPARRVGTSSDLDVPPAG